MLRIAICDDNNAICSQIEGMILEYKKNNLIEIEVEVFWTGENLIKFIENEGCFDLIFLDIELGTTTGIEVGSKIRDVFDDYSSKIVFITSKNGYEIQLFDIQPLNFLRKPIEAEKIFKCINLCLKIIGVENNVFEYKKQHSICRIKTKDVFYFEKISRKIKIVTTLGEDIFNDTMTNIIEELPTNFIISHESFIVNFNRISLLNNNTIVMLNGHEIPISRRNLSNVRLKLVDLEMEK